MSCVPPSAATPLQSDSPPAPPLDLAELAADGPWLAAVESFAGRNPRRHDRLAEYETLLADGAHRRIGVAVLERRYRPAPPEERWINKLDGRKKRVFRYPPADELLFRTLNRLLQPAAAEAASPWCRSFLPGGGARATFRCVLDDPALGDRSVLRLDVRDYFNSVDVSHALATLPGAFAAGPVRALLEVALRDRRVLRNGRVVDGGPKGLMAGTPLAPLLATLYLRDLDHEMAADATYARYSDDFLVAAAEDRLPDLERRLRRRLAERGLVVNESKTARSAPGEPWDFLGFRYAGGWIGLAPVTERKFKARATRLGRALLRWRDRSGAPPGRVVGAYLRRSNRRLYGVPGERADFSWATWFLPLIDSPDQLAALDEHLRRECRYAATGRRTGRARQLVPYDRLVAAGHLPLVSSYWALQEGPAPYEALVGRRTRLTARRSDQEPAAIADSSASRSPAPRPAVSSTTG